MFSTLPTTLPGNILGNPETSRQRHEIQVLESHPSD